MKMVEQNAIRGMLNLYDENQNNMFILLSYVVQNMTGDDISGIKLHLEKQLKLFVFFTMTGCLFFRKTDAHLCGLNVVVEQSSKHCSATFCMKRM